MGVDEKLKKFIEDHFDFYSLKQAGVFDKTTRKSDYEKIAKKICFIFDFQSIYEYDPPQLVQTSSTSMCGKFNDAINNNGELERGEGFHLDIVQTEFVCPICECEQDATDHAAYNKYKFPMVTIKCKGCKRKLILIENFGGNLTVKEK